MNTEQVFAPLSDSRGALPNGSGEVDEHFEPIIPTPREPYREEYIHKTFGVPGVAYKYFNSVGDIEGYVCRWDVTKGDKRCKEMRPLRYGVFNGQTGYHWKGWRGDTERPLYGLPLLQHLGAGAPVILVEGEKTADAAAKLLPDFAVVSPMNGSKSAHLSDMTPLAGHEVTVWPDHDTAGIDFAHAVAKLALKAGAISVRIVKVPAGWLRHQNSGISGPQCAEFPRC